eukprot:SAG31_NODE_3449_length_4257_cov_2.277297_5_plen_103_part_00
MSGDLHEMQAALAAAAELGKDQGLEARDAIELAQQAHGLRSALEAQGGDAALRLMLNDSPKIDTIVGRFWRLMQVESKKMHHAASCSPRPFERSKVAGLNPN